MMKNLANSENWMTFQEKRSIFKPYGLTCERWAPQVMGKCDRHNEIELNFIPKGSLSYFFHNRLVVVPEGKLSLFGGLVSHKIVDSVDVDFYYVATIPLSLFLCWRMPAQFVNDLLNGIVLTDSYDHLFDHDNFLFDSWIEDIAKSNYSEIVLLEMQSRLMRLAFHYTSCFDNYAIDSREVDKIEAMAIYIAKNYEKPIKMSELGNAVGLNPNYANSLFKKAFGHTLMEHVMIERITHAQRQLILTRDSILQISFDCGFASISSFNMAFRKINNCTPREYRERNFIRNEKR